MRLYFGANPLNVVVPQAAPPPPPNPDWPLTLVSADGQGNAVVKVPCLDPAGYTKPDDVVVAYVPGTDVPATPEAALAVPGVLTASFPFPASFGIGLDQSVPVQVAGLKPGPYVVVAIGRVGVNS
jgi:hypothetical protein